MSDVLIQPLADGSYQVSGELTLFTVGSVLGRNILPLGDHGAMLRLDLSQVSYADSGGLALLIAWARQAREADKSLIFYGVSGKLASLARVTGVDRVLSFQ